MTTRLWWVRPETFLASPAMLGLLSDQERAQQQRFLPPAKRQEYLVTRILVRSVLGEVLGVAPQALQFVSNEWGRPALVTALSHSPLYFNVSHTEGLIVCLVSTEGEVGVDTESFARAPDLLTLAPDVFSAKELSDLAALPVQDQAQRAVVLWTLKESYIKARGMGLSIPLDKFSFRFESGGVRLEVEPELGDDGKRWQLQSQTFGSHCISTAIALPNTDTIEYLTFCPGDFGFSHEQ
jgi:4'-phosphopantetheinyl transferase